MTAEILLYAKKGTRCERDDDPSSGYSTAFIRVSRIDALRMIQSLAEQIIHNNPNYNRQEMFAHDGLGKTWLVTVAVVPEVSK